MSKKDVLNIKKKSIDRDMCFVIMPFGGWFDQYYTEIYKPAVTEAGLEPKRSDDLYRPSQIVQDIWNYTKKAKILLADLTGKNPNVFYELGLAHALAKPVILVTESEVDVPFDLRNLRYIVYDKNEPNWGINLKKGIINAIKETIETPGESVLQAFVDTEKKIGTKQTVIPMKKQILALEKKVAILTGQNAELGRIRQAIGPREAETLINNYLEQNMPRSMILNRLERFGVPHGWAENTIVRLITNRNKNIH